ncbi:hypothetical protein PCK2_000050, partial [Pneumocystis canis]
LNNIPNFPYNFEKIIDDFILLAFFVGNDFLPHLPKLYINGGALALVFNIYKKVIPKAGGYINNAGVINLERLVLVLEELEKQEREDFKNELEDKNSSNSKKKVIHVEQYLDKKKSLIMSSNQKKLFLEMEKFVVQNLQNLELSALSLEDRHFVSKMADDFHVKCTKYTTETGNYLFLERYDDMGIENTDEIKIAINKELDRYRDAVILDTEKDDLEKEKAIFDEKWMKWKDLYYIEKLGFSINDTEKLREMTENYVEGLQWVLFYYYRWPYLHEARVNAVSTENFRYDGVFSPKKARVTILKTCHDSSAWKKVALKLELNYKKHYGTLINTVYAIVHVSMLKGLRKTEDGGFEKDYEPCNSENSEHPLQLVLNEVAVEDARYIEKPPLDIKQEYPIGSRGFFLGEYNYGRPLEITAHKNGKIDCWIATQTREPEFGRLIYENFSRNTIYYPSYVAAKMSGLTGLAFSKLMSSFYVMVDKQKVNLGLNLKYEAKKIKVIGYSRKTERGWEYTQGAVNLIQEYKKRFPEFIHSVQSYIFDDIPLINNLIPENNYKEKVKEIKSWLKNTNEENNFEKVTLDVEQFDKFSMEMVEKELDKIAENISLFTPKRINNVPRNAVLKPSQCELRLQDQVFSLGDRVIYVHDSGKVPIATKGIVVRTGKKMIDIIFDVPFMSGTTLGGKCSAYRGLSVETHFVLNLTKRALIVPTKRSINRRNPKVIRKSSFMMEKMVQCLKNCPVKKDIKEVSLPYHGAQTQNMY